MDIEYRINTPISADQFIDLLNRSSLGERRPTDDRECIQGMLDHSSLTVTAWRARELVGAARSITDYHYACYLSDLAVRACEQASGIGKALQALTQEQLGPRCKLILLAAPAANTYYEHIGFTHNPRCWMLERDARIHGVPDAVISR